MNLKKWIESYEECPTEKFHGTIFLDCGANTGQSIEMTKDKLPDSLQWINNHQIISFEANPLLINHLKTKYPRNYVYNYIVSDYNGLGELFIDGRDGMFGSTIYNQKLNTPFAGKVLVRTIDLSEWITKNISQNSYIRLKLDIEGAEYIVLDKLIQSGVITRINELYCELHSKKIPGSEGIHKRVITNLKKLKLEIQPWSDKLVGLDVSKEK